MKLEIPLLTSGECGAVQIGWGATTKFHEDWVWDQAAETYALDSEMADKLRKNNPQA